MYLRSRDGWSRSRFPKGRYTCSESPAVAPSGMRRHCMGESGSHVCAGREALCRTPPRDDAAVIPCRHHEDVIRGLACLDLKVNHELMRLGAGCVPLNEKNGATFREAFFLAWACFISSGLWGSVTGPICRRLPVPRAGSLDSAGRFILRRPHDDVLPRAVAGRRTDRHVPRSAHAKRISLSLSLSETINFNQAVVWELVGGSLSVTE